MVLQISDLVSWVPLLAYCKTHMEGNVLKMWISCAITSSQPSIIDGTDDGPDM